MKYYFFSPIKAALYINGKPLSRLGKNVLCFESDQPLSIEIRSFSEFEPCLADPFDRSFDRNIERFPFFDGELFLPKFRYACKQKIEPIAETAVSVFGAEYRVYAHIDGFFKLSVSGYRDYLTVPLLIKPTTVAAQKHGEFLIVDAADRLRQVFVFSLNPLKCLFNSVCDEFALSDYLIVSKIKRGACEYICREHYGFDGGFSLFGRDVIANRSAAELKSEAAFSLSFLERAIWGGDVAPFLSANLRNDAEKIAGFIGKASFVIPPCKIEHPSTFVLVGDSIKYASIFVENGKITDVDIRDDPF